MRPKPIALTQFYRSLHARGETVTSLAERLLCGRSHLSQVLSGARPGTQTWRRIHRARVLTPAELALLGRTPPPVPRGNLFPVEHPAPPGGHSMISDLP